MAKQLGRALLVKIDDGAGTLSNLCGLNSKSFTLNNSSIDVTTPDCTTPEGALYTQTLAGLKNASVSGDGFFEDSTTEARMNTVAMANDNSTNFEIVIPDFGTYAGAFRITSLEFGGETEGGVTYSVALESTGAITFTAA
jgi:TP901-1 family phage major tail protein